MKYDWLICNLVIVHQGGASCSVRSDRNELRDLKANPPPFKLDLRNLFLLQHAFLQAARYVSMVQVFLIQ